MSFDQVMVTGSDALNEVVQRAGMGWCYSTRDLAWRVNSHTHSLATQGFPAGTQQLLERLNRCDSGLFLLSRHILGLDASFWATAAALGLHITHSAAPSQNSISPPSKD